MFYSVNLPSYTSPGKIGKLSDGSSDFAVQTGALEVWDKLSQYKKKYSKRKDLEDFFQSNGALSYAKRHTER